MSNLEIVIVIEFLQVPQPDDSLFPAVKMSKGLPRLDESNLFSGLFNDSEPFQEFNDNLQERRFNLRVDHSLPIVILLFRLERHNLPHKVPPTDKPIPPAIKLLKDLIQLPVTTRDPIPQVPSHLCDDDLVVAL